MWNSSPYVVAPQRVRARAAGLVVALIAALAVASTATADRYVSTTGSDSANGCSNPSQPCRSIQWALGQVGSDETIKIETGTYQENVVIGRELVGITIEGGYGPGGSGPVLDPSSTVIDGGAIESTIRIDLSDENLDLTLRNFELTGGLADWGGGLHVDAPIGVEAWLRIENVEFANNRAHGGGGLYLITQFTSPAFAFHLHVEDSVFSDNTSTGWGGGISVHSHNQLDMQLRDNTFQSNVSNDAGAALRVEGNIQTAFTTVLMERNVVEGNTTGSWGAVVFEAKGFMGRVRAFLRNNLIIDNQTGIVAIANDTASVQLDLEYDTVTGNTGAGGVVCDVVYPESGAHVDVEVRGGILRENDSSDLAIDFACVGRAGHSNIGAISVSTSSEPTVPDGTFSDLGGNIDADPLFLDSAGGDYRLHWDSPSVDAVDCATTVATDDHNQDPRPDTVTGLCDMGCFEVGPALLDNGQASNVIDDDRYAAHSGLDVANLSCTPGASCPPGQPPTTATLTSGAVLGPWIRGFHTSQLIIRGGVTPGGALYAFDESTLRLVGSGFRVDGLPVPMGELAATTGTLTGTLDSGDPVDVSFHHAGDAGAYDGTLMLQGPFGTHLVNDGATHTIDDYTYQDDVVYVRNDGCSLWPYCAAPGAPSRLNLTDGSTRELQVFENSSLDMSDGFVAGSLLANSDARLTLRGGSVRDDLVVFDSAAAHLGQAGSGSVVIGDVFAFGSSNVAVTWGYVSGDIRSYDTTSIGVSRGGGTSGGRKLEARGSSVIDVFGYDFQVDGFDVPYGELAATAGRLTGYFAVDDYSILDFQRVGGRIRLLEAQTTYLNSGTTVPLSGDIYEFQRVYVRNQGCSGEPQAPCGSSAVGTHLQLGSGAVVGSRLYVSDDSTLTMNGGVIGGRLHAYHDAHITLSAGEVRVGVRTQGDSMLEMTDGWMMAIAATERSTVTLEGGIIYRGASADQFATLNLSGALVQGGASATTMANVTVSAGHIQGTLDFQSRGSLAFSGGIMNGSLRAHSGAVSMSGGRVIGDLEAGSFGPAAMVTVSGGEIVGNVVASGSAQVDVTGGLFADQFEARDSSTLRIAGSDFRVNGQPVGLGELSATQGTLTGTLQSGDALDVRFYQGQPSGSYTGTIELVPEPGLALLQGLALFAIAGLRASRRPAAG